MIIDVHTHVGLSQGDFPKEYMPVGSGMVALVSATKGRPWEANRSEYTNQPTHPFEDPTGEVSYKTLTELSVDKAVLLAIDFTMMGEGRYRKGASWLSPRSVEEINKHVADVAAEYPDKYIAFVSIDPRHGQRGLELLRMAVEEWGMKGLKVHPSAGYYPNDLELCYPFYELCCSFDIPVLYHCGMELYPMSGKWADPMFLDEVASDFPEMRICLAHGGGGFAHVPSRHLFDVGLALATIHDNVFLDIASAQAIYARNPVEFYQDLRRGLDHVAGKIMWGTDNPMLEVTGITWKQYLEAIQNPDPTILKKAGVSFTKEERDGILGENAKHWLKLE